jgi:hypothetical protein
MHPGMLPQPADWGTHAFAPVHTAIVFLARLRNARARGRGRVGGKRPRRRRRAHLPTRVERSSAFLMLAKLEFLLYGPSVAARDVANWVAAPDAADPRPHVAPAPPRPGRSSIISLLGTSPHLVQNESKVKDAPDCAPVARRATAVGVVCAPHSLHAGVAGRCRKSLRAPASAGAAASPSLIVCTVTRTRSGARRLRHALHIC